MSDRLDRQRRGSEDAERCVGQGQHAFGVRVAVKKAAQETAHFLEAKVPVRFHQSPREPTGAREDSWFAGLPHQL